MASELIEEVRRLRTAGRQQGSTSSDDFVDVPAEANMGPWATLFSKYFVDQALGDDLLFLVPYGEHPHRL